MPKYVVRYSVTDEYETEIEVDDPAEIEDYINDHAWEDDFDRSWVGGGIEIENHWEIWRTNA